MALHLGDRTAKDAGRLTLNPIKHLDLFGSIILPLITYRLGFIFGYAKPVPYNPYNLRDKKYGPAKVAMAGPLTNITLAILLGLVIRFLDFSGWAVSVQFVELLKFIVSMNLILAVFNLVPIPPLDGHWLVLTFVPDRYFQFKQAYARSGWFIFILFLLFGFALILPIVSWLFRLIVGS
ncbi:MAG: site-2 protease family protein [bacterium]|nr:site-2 protease family protein [bacterium]